MSGIARWDLETGRCMDDYACRGEMGRYDDGDYVLFDDHEAEVAGLRALVARQAEALRGLKDELYRRSDAVNTGTNAEEWHEENGRRLGYEGAAEAVAEAEEVLLADPCAASALEWLEREKSKAVREALEALVATIEKAEADLAKANEGKVFPKALTASFCADAIKAVLATAKESSHDYRPSTRAARPGEPGYLDARPAHGAGGAGRRAGDPHAWRRA